MGAGQQVKYIVAALHEPSILRWKERHYRIWTGIHDHGGTGGWLVGWQGVEGGGGGNSDLHFNFNYEGGLSVYGFMRN
jgi:hypothetical protein